MTGSAPLMEHSASAVVKGVAKKSALLLIVGSVASVAVQMMIAPGLAPWLVPAGVLFGGALGVINFRWLAFAVERVYLGQGVPGVLANLAAGIISVLKLSAIFIVLYFVITAKFVHLVGLVVGLSLCFLAILWEGLTLVGGKRADGQR